MTKYTKPEMGITLLEMLLIIAVIGAILIAGLQQIYTFRQSSEALAVRTNVDLIMSAMGHYYFANCGGREGNWGTLNPHNATFPPDPFPINIVTDLQEKRYLQSPININAYVDYAQANTTQGYVAQFNLTETTQTICTGAINEGEAVTSLTPAGNCKGTVDSGKIFRWTPQVAVKLKNSSTVAIRKSALNLLRGDCLSVLNGDTVDPCTPDSDGPYVVFSRNPSLPNMYEYPPTWTNHWNLTHFSQANKNYPFSYLVETGGKTPSGEFQYFVCGD